MLWHDGGMCLCMRVFRREEHKKTQAAASTSCESEGGGRGLALAVRVNLSPAWVP